MKRQKPPLQQHHQAGSANAPDDATVGNNGSESSYLRTDIPDEEVDIAIKKATKAFRDVLNAT